MRLSASLPGTRLNWLPCVVASLALSGCVTEVVCRYPAPPAPLMEPAPPPESFQDRLDAILDRTSTGSPAKPTK